MLSLCLLCALFSRSVLFASQHVAPLWARPLPPRAILPVCLKVVQWKEEVDSHLPLVSRWVRSPTQMHCKSLLAAVCSYTFSPDAAKLRLPAERCNHLPVFLRDLVVLHSQPRKKQPVQHILLRRQRQSWFECFTSQKNPYISKITGCQMNSRCVWKEGIIRGTVYRRKTIPALHSCDAANRWSSSAMDTNCIKRAQFSQIDTASKHIKTNHRASYQVKV